MPSISEEGAERAAKMLPVCPECKSEITIGRCGQCGFYDVGHKRGCSIEAKHNHEARPVVGVVNISTTEHIAMHRKFMGG